jgi:hypothetical protein
MTFCVLILYSESSGRGVRALHDRYLAGVSGNNAAALAVHSGQILGCYKCLDLGPASTGSASDPADRPSLQHPPRGGRLSSAVTPFPI